MSLLICPICNIKLNVGNNKGDSCHYCGSKFKINKENLPYSVLKPQAYKIQQHTTNLILFPSVFFLLFGEHLGFSLGIIGGITFPLLSILSLAFSATSYKLNFIYMKGMYIYKHKSPTFFKVALLIPPVTSIGLTISFFLIK